MLRDQLNLATRPLLMTMTQQTSVQIFFVIVRSSVKKPKEKNNKYKKLTNWIR